MEHRKTPARRIFVLPGWFFIVIVALVLAGAVWLGMVLANGSDSGKVGPAPKPTVSVSPQVEPSVAPTTASPSASPSQPPGPKVPSQPADQKPSPVVRNLPVSVLNNTGIAGLARTVGGEAQRAGWSPVSVGNWRGSIEANTVYYPENGRAQAEQLAKDLGFERVRPRVSPMRDGRLTVILVGRP